MVSEAPNRATLMSIPMFSGSSIPIESLRTTEDLLISKMAVKDFKMATKKFKMSAKNHIHHQNLRSEAPGSAIPMSIPMFSRSRNPVESFGTAGDLLISKVAAKKLQMATTKFKMTAKNHIKSS